MPRKIPIDSHYFDNMNPNSCYWAGFIAADGNICGISKFSLALSEKDIAHLKLFQSDIGSAHKLTRRRPNNYGSVVISLDIRDKKLCKTLIENFNITPAKSRTYEPPSLQPKMQRHFIRGLIDGDGSVGLNHVGFYTASIVCSSYVNDYLATIDGVSKSKISSRGRTFVIQWSSGTSKKIIHHLYSDAPRALDRKKRIYAELYL